MNNLHRQNGRAGGSICIFIYESVDFKERKELTSNNNSELLPKQMSFLVQFIGYPILV